jgi:hypothetical protein
MRIFTKSFVLVSQTIRYCYVTTSTVTYLFDGISDLVP